MDAYYQDQCSNQESQPGQIPSHVQYFDADFPYNENDYTYIIGIHFMRFGSTRTPAPHNSGNSGAEDTQIKSENDTPKNILDLDLHKAKMSEYGKLQSGNPNSYTPRYVSSLITNWNQCSQVQNQQNMNQGQIQYGQTDPSSCSTQNIFQTHQIPPTIEYTTQGHIEQSSTCPNVIHWHQIPTIEYTSHEHIEQSSTCQNVFQSHQIPTGEYFGNAVPTHGTHIQAVGSATKSASRKSNKARMQNTNNYCITCYKWFNSSVHLKRHYGTKKHKNAVKYTGQPDPATLPISAHHHPTRESTTRKDSSSNSPSEDSRGDDDDNTTLQSASPGLLQQPSSGPDDIQPASNMNQPSPLQSPMVHATLLEKRESDTNPDLNIATTVQPKIDEGEIKCYLCDKSFKATCYLRQHNNASHSGKKPYKCTRCGKSFACEIKCAQHFQKHDGIKPHQCEICSKQFNYKADLNRHISTHTGNMRFKCETCGKGFARQDHMLKHCETHTRKAQVMQSWLEGNNNLI